MNRVFRSIYIAFLIGAFLCGCTPEPRWYSIGKSTGRVVALSGNGGDIIMTFPDSKYTSDLFFYGILEVPLEEVFIVFSGDPKPSKFREKAINYTAFDFFKCVQLYSEFCLTLSNEEREAVLREIHRMCTMGDYEAAFEYAANELLR